MSQDEVGALGDAEFGRVQESVDVTDTGEVRKKHTPRLKFSEMLTNPPHYYRLLHLTDLVQCICK